MGYPLLVKAVMGGGGKGMKLARQPAEFLVGGVLHTGMQDGGWLWEGGQAGCRQQPTSDAPPLLYAARRRRHCTRLGARRWPVLATTGCYWSGSSLGRATSR